MTISISPRARRRIVALSLAAAAVVGGPQVALAQDSSTGTGIGINIGEPATARRLAKLPRTVAETSALVYHGGRLYTINDSGNRPEIYEIDTATFEVRRAAVVRNAPNRDWESLAISGGRVYIGDLGNNLGGADSLRVLYFPLDSLEAGSVDARFIEVRYADWAAPAQGRYSTRFDCEAMLPMGDSLWLLTKDWERFQTAIYVVPAAEGSYTPSPAATLPAGMLVTDACHGPEPGTAWLTGYDTGYRSHIALLRHDGTPAGARLAERREIQHKRPLQNEGITFVGRRLWMSAEKTLRGPAAIYQIEP